MKELKFLQSISIIDDEEYITLKDTKGKVVLEGDYYHDKINEKIDGFVAGLNYLGYSSEIIEVDYEV